MPAHSAKAICRSFAQAFDRFDRVLGVLSLRKREDEQPPVPIEEIERLIEERQAAKRRRDFAGGRSHSCRSGRARRAPGGLAAGYALEAKVTLPDITTSLPGPKAKALIERDAAVVSPSYTRGYPLVIKRASGASVEDVDGNMFLDCAAGIAVNSTGHSHPDVVRAITDQAQRFLHMSGTDFYYDVQVRLAEELAAMVPIDGGARSFFAQLRHRSGRGVHQARAVRHGTAEHHRVLRRVSRAHDGIARAHREQADPAPRLRTVHARRVPCAVCRLLSMSGRSDDRRTAPPSVSISSTTSCSCIS